MELRRSHPLEGKIVILSFEEEDPAGEGTAHLVYTVKDARLKAIFGPECLPKTAAALSSPELDRQVIDSVKLLGVREVYTPIWAPQFMGISFLCKEFLSVVSPYGRPAARRHQFNIMLWNFRETLTKEGITVHTFSEISAVVDPV